MGAFGVPLADYYNVPAHDYLPGYSTPSPDPPRPLNPADLPRPVAHQDKPQGLYSTVHTPAPPPESLYSVKEQGLSSPRFLRFTMNYIPIDNSLYKSAGPPLAASWQPFAELPISDDPVQASPSPPFRCSNCLAYINPFFKFLEGRQKCSCNMCGSLQDYPELYSGNRSSRPELFAGTYEFRAPAEYTNRPVQPPLFLFCIDISSSSLKLGLPSQVLSSLLAVLDYIPDSDRVEIGILTFDEHIQLYSLGPTGNLLEIVITDVEDPFLSEPVSGCCFNVKSNREQLESLIDKLTLVNFSVEFKKSVSVGALAQALKDTMLRGRGGRVLVFASKIGDVGLHALAARPDKKLRPLFQDQDCVAASNYLRLGEECCGEDMCIDIFVCTTTTVNIPDLGALCTLSGGDLYYFPGFNLEVDGDRLHYKIARVLTRAQCSQALMRVRCSNGLSVDYYIGKYRRKGPMEMEVACLDSDKAFAVVLKYDEHLREDKEYFVQGALLYTSARGERVIRIFNGRLYATTSMASVYKYADADTITNIMLKTSVSDLFAESLTAVRDKWKAMIARVLTCFKKLCGRAVCFDFCCPESLQLLPLYCSAAFKLNALILSEVSMDSRMYSVHAILGFSVLQTRLLLYPTVYSVHDIVTQGNSPGTCEGGVVALPATVPASMRSLKPEGVYLISNGDILAFYVGKEANTQFLSNTWGVQSAGELFGSSDHREALVICDRGTEESQKLMLVLEEINKHSPAAHAAAYYHFQGHSPSNYMIKKLMVEDSFAAEMAYEVFLMDCIKLSNANS